MDKKTCETNDLNTSNLWAEDVFDLNIGSIFAAELV